MGVSLSHQFGGLKILVDTLEIFSDNAPLLIKAMQTLDNLVSADAEYAFAAQDRMVHDTLLSIMDDFRDEPEVRPIAGPILTCPSASPDPLCCSLHPPKNAHVVAPSPNELVCMWILGQKYGRSVPAFYSNPITGHG